MVELTAFRYSADYYDWPLCEMMKLSHHLKYCLLTGISLLMSLHAHTSTTMDQDTHIPTTLASKPWSVDLPSDRPQWTEAEAEQLRVRGQAVLQ